MRGLKAFLEEFDREAPGPSHAGPEPLDIRLQQEKAAAYAAGFAAGESAARNRSSTDSEFLQNALIRIDQALKEHIADGHAQLTKALSSVIETVFPGLAEKALPEELAAMIGRQPVLRSGAAVVVTVSPKQASAFEQRVASVRSDLPVKIETDDALSELEASVRWDKAGVDVNFSKTIEQIETYLEALLDQYEKRKTP